MDNKSNKKLKIILIVSVILLISIAYYVSIAIAIDNMNRDMKIVTFNNYSNDSLTNVALEKTRWAIFLMPWNKEIRSNEVSLLWKLKDFKGALDAAQENGKINPTGMNYTIEGMAYEYLGELGMAKLSYHRALNIYEEEFKERPNDDFLITEISFLSMIVGDTNRANYLIANRKDTGDEPYERFVRLSNEMILEYKSGGMLVFFVQMNN